MYHNYDLNNVQDLQKIVFGLTFAMVSGSPVDDLKNFKDFDQALQEINKLNDAQVAIRIGTEFSDLETLPCSEAAFELTTKLLRGEKVSTL